MLFPERRVSVFLWTLLPISFQLVVLKTARQINIFIPTEVQMYFYHSLSMLYLTRHFLPLLFTLVTNGLGSFQSLYSVGLYSLEKLLGSSFILDTESATNFCHFSAIRFVNQIDHIILCQMYLLLINCWLPKSVLHVHVTNLKYSISI